MKRIAVYGSLKKGRYNHSFLDGCTHLGDTTVRGTLYKVSSYPALIDEGENEYDAEVYEVSDEIYQRINRMELGAGYKEVTIQWEESSVIVYYADTRLAEMCKNHLEQIDTY